SDIFLRSTNEPIDVTFTVPSDCQFLKVYMYFSGNVANDEFRLNYVNMYKVGDSMNMLMDVTQGWTAVQTLLSVFNTDNMTSSSKMKVSVTTKEEQHQETGVMYNQQIPVSESTTYTIDYRGYTSDNCFNTTPVITSYDALNNASIIIMNSNDYLQNIMNQVSIIGITNVVTSKTVTFTTPANASYITVGFIFD